VDVDLTTIEVAAPDKNDNPVRNLKKEDFQLYEEGERQEILSIDEVRTGSAISLIFRLCNLSRPSDRWDVAAKARLLDGKEKEYVPGQIPLNKAMSPLGKAEATVGLGMTFKDAPPGKYRLIIEASEAATGGIATLQTDLEFIK
jgi:hypothetical protein